MSKEAVKIGVLFSQSGHMSVTEQAHIQGVLLACAEINAAGGIDGAPLEPVILNPASDNRLFADMATELLLNHGVNTIFGCCLSSSRKAVVPVIDRFNGILFYPSVYEGFEYSPNIIYGGAVPNQMVVPLLQHVFKNYGKRIALIGSDTLFAREINRIVSEFMSSSGGVIVRKSHIQLNASAAQMKSELDAIEMAQPDVILSTVIGQDSVTLYNAYAQTELTGCDIPIASLTTTESELAQISPAARAGHLSIASYFGSIKSPTNDRFKSAYNQRFGRDTIPGVYTEVCYSLVHFYANAVRLSKTTETDNILQALSGAVFKGPGSDLSIDIDTNHFTLRPHIGLSKQDGSFDVVWKSPNAIRPDPYLVSYDRSISEQMV